MATKANIIKAINVAIKPHLYLQHVKEKLMNDRYISSVLIFQHCVNTRRLWQ